MVLYRNTNYAARYECRVFRWLAVVIVCAMALPAHGQEIDCIKVRAIAEMARSRRTQDLSKAKERAGDDYRSRIVFAARMFQLRPRDRNAAARLLGAIPRNEREQTVIITLGESLCDSEPTTDMTVLARLRDALPRLFASAVISVPARMGDYVMYAFRSTQSPHGDYAVHMQRVCRQAKVEFQDAVRTLPSDKALWFREHIFDPKSCRALALPEAE